MADSTPSEREWIVFWERDDQWAVTVSAAGGEREVSCTRVTADGEDAAILAAVGGRGTMQDDYRVWAIPAGEIHPRPFTVNAVTNYVTVLGEPYIR